MESAIQKDLKNGFFLCTICQTQVKAKAWTAHVNGRKHRENVQNLKKQLLAKSMEANKRKLSESENEDTDSKRQKVNNSDSESEETDHNEEKPGNLAIKESTSNNIPIDNHTSSSIVNNNIIEGLPEGFFDNAQMNNRVRDTMEKQKHLDSELDRYYKEVAEADHKAIEEEEIETEELTVQRNIEEIDEQMERWKNINELEKKKEEVVETVRQQHKQVPNMDSMDTDDIDEISDSEFDFNSIDWRAKVL